ncbi:MAG TPA: AAA family ATPase [Prolixibacteraceae bacterium]|nr:AAA family ATPase [Prolixibacteraceae bacterium]
MYIRKQIFEGLRNESAFLWGARQTGKSTLLKWLFPDVLYFDLLLSSEFERFKRNPMLLVEIIQSGIPKMPVIIDEIQRLPELLNTVHWLIVNKGIQFILSGSSPRKILSSGGNLLGGRAFRYELFPLVSAEIPDFNLDVALNNGLLPRHYQSRQVKKLHSAYIGSYLKDEIMAEARIRNADSFTRFLEVAAFSNGESVNYTNIAAECGVSSPTVRTYFEILEDTLTGRSLPSFQKKPKRRIIHASKFYYFDLGLANYLLKRTRVEPGTETFGKAFEHFIFQELTAHSSYSGINYPLSYWRTSSGIEVDFILGDHEVAIEVKSSQSVHPRHLSGLKSFSEDYSAKHKIMVTNEPYPRQVDGIQLLPWKVFLENLWSGAIIS